MKKTDWFEAGSTAYQDDGCGADLLPPLNDMEAQREWLGGFGVAWALALEDERSVDEVLARRLAEREELLRQLRSHATGRSSWSLH